MAYDRDIRDNAAMDSAGTNNPGTNPGAEQILPGAPVFDAAGEQIGAVDDAGFTGGMLGIHQSGIFARDTAVPMDAIARTDASGVYLTLTKEQMKSEKGKSDRGRRSDTPGATSAAEGGRPSRPASNARTRPTDMATDSGSPQADLDVPPPGER